MKKQQTITRLANAMASTSDFFEWRLSCDDDVERSGGYLLMSKELSIAESHLERLSDDLKPAAVPTIRNATRLLKSSAEGMRDFAFAFLGAEMDDVANEADGFIALLEKEVENMLANNKRILVAVPEKLLGLADEAACALQMSRVAFVRQAIAMRLATYRRTERPMMMFENEQSSKS